MTSNPYLNVSMPLTSYLNQTESRRKPSQPLTPTFTNASWESSEQKSGERVNKLILYLCGEVVFKPEPSVSIWSDKRGREQVSTERDADD